ncbi:IS1182 family transposase [Adhaeribacter radiodurans]|uniref:IS1182 family transposase n=1 Tax=Adhaeribacter radiodurans TaxID=2745197 RepID=A0A7L7L7N4_9BACT|nr:IS1182 family transposase [Adhaeribacter radiodurans]QMU28807.1 IS1182 family transposase [Adhaeribacter radiodurans]QMU29168.1 IS1182 family transposase [Adhaeribacter radiodurans]
MQGKKVVEDEKVLLFSLSAHVPEHNFYRQLKQQLNLDFLYELTQPYYGRCGQQSIDPVVFLKLCLVGYLENITSDRKLIEHCSLRLDLLYFLDYQLDEPLPWHSTVSRTRQLYPEALFESLFDQVFRLCVEKGMVAGHQHAIDSAPIKANASMDSLLLKQPTETLEMHLVVNAPTTNGPSQNTTRKPEQFVSAPEHQLRKLEKHQDHLRETPKGLGGHHEKARLVSNKTHYSPADPDARISVKPGKARQLNYHCSLAVDTATGVISHVQADFADGRDSQYLPAITCRLQRRLLDNDLHLAELLADGGYSNGSNYAFLEQRKITGWIPVFGQYKPEIAGFPYDQQADHFTCLAGKVLAFKTYDTNAEGGLLKIYRATYQDCKQCSLKPTCVPKSQCRQITRTAYDPEYRRALARQQSRKGKRMKRLRHSTVEPVFGSLIQHYGLRKIGVRGKAGAHKVMLLAACAFNLKKYLKFKPVKVVSQAIALQKEQESAFIRYSFALTKQFST